MTHNILFMSCGQYSIHCIRGWNDTIHNILMTDFPHSKPENSGETGLLLLTEKVYKMDLVQDCT